ncbi:DUF2029 domain-containing protein [Roseomonas eburnea]|uniref:DUF2029 domain-containing protein n=1 Tax=Neoroseomonas eburnea TaxID=1346889 RepID=A0A9X9XA88_9PROT|nr:glycosyltransferase family 87 protein [Neoroseomonas eburnea]MBR0680624.1 DUF2029 domain-containing protein [Neoroseomonas eburnea]
MAGSGGAWLTGRSLLFGSVFVVIIYAALLVGGIVMRAGAPPIADYLAFHAAGRLAAEGAAADAYDWAVLHAAHAGILGEPVPGRLGWLNPPTFFFAILPFSALPYRLGWLVWILASGVAFALAARAILPRAAAVAAALAVPPVMFTASVGQNGLLTAALLGATLALLDRRPVAAGIALGLLTVKPQFGLLFPILLAASGRWRSFLAAAATALALAAAACLAFGTEAWIAFLEASGGNAERLLANGQDVSPRILSVHAFVMRATGQEALAAALHALVALAATVVTLRLWLRRPEGPEEARAAAAIAGAFLVTPYVWGYDMPAIAMAALFLARAGLRDGFMPAERALIVLACAWPAVLVAQPHPLVGPAAWLLILVLAWRRDRAWRLAPARPSTGSA